LPDSGTIAVWSVRELLYPLQRKAFRDLFDLAGAPLADCLNLWYCVTLFTNTRW
jgi:hypothetical protein